MQQYQGGEIIVIKFPFADRMGAKIRPALILRDTGDDDIIVALITSRAPQSGFDCVLAEWRQAGLVQPSVARVDKLLTTAKASVRSQPGTLTPQDWAQVRARVRQLWASM